MASIKMLPEEATGFRERSLIVGENSQIIEFLNSLTADQRSAWVVDQVWAEYKTSRAQLKLPVETMPDKKWDGIS